MRLSSRASTLNSLARMVSSTRSLAPSSTAAKSPLRRRDVAPQRVERVAAGLVDQHARDHVEPFVAGGAGNAGKRRQRLAVGQDFLDHDVERLARSPPRTSRISCCSRRVYCAGSSRPSM